MRAIVVTSQEAGQRLDRYLAKYMAKAPKSFFYKMMRKKNITLNGKKAAGMEKLKEGDEIKLFLSDETIEGFCGDSTGHITVKVPKKKLSVVYEDDEVLVINKPAGMLSQKARKEDISLVEYITDYVMSEEEQKKSVFRPGICNRLDRNTTGLVVSGKTVESLQYLNRLFKERKLNKYYLCIVQGRVCKKERIDGYLYKDEKKNKVSVQKKEGNGAARIITAYEPLAYGTYRGEAYTLLKVHLITGKSHQIRAHLSSIGHPLIGDAKYGNRQNCLFFQKEFGLKYQLLHAWKLCLLQTDYLPERLWQQEWNAPLPADFQKIIKKIGMDWRE